jgi:uncharacterized lipoprotein YddW (UPF0748 family)
MSRRSVTLIFLLGLVLLLSGSAMAQQSSGLTIYFYQDGQATPVTRPTLPQGEPQSDAETLLAALVAGPTAEEHAAGLTSPFPPGAELDRVTVIGDVITVDLRLPLGYLRIELGPDLSDAIVELVVKTVHPLGLHQVHIRAEDEDGAFRPLSSFLPRLQVPAPTVPENDDPVPEHVGQPPGFGQGRPQGALSGKTVWLSAGHGWYWSSSLGRWLTQRPNITGIIEDFSNAEAVNYYLARYLWNAGADVWLVRERAMTDHEIIVDNDHGAPSYTETGAWDTSGSPGYANGTYRYAISSSGLSAAATWTPNLPQAGWYAVWAWYRSGTNRTTDARYQIHHAGGVTTVRLSQEVHGQTWYYLGEYYFQGGTGGHVTLVNQSDDVGQAVIADAVRFGGGLGSSGEPRWEEAAKYWAWYQGAPSEVYGAPDRSSRPLYAEWETAKGYPGEAENAVYLSWHTNAGGATGTESYIASTDPTPGSAALQDWLHAELVSDLRAAWNPGWVNRGQKTADFSEVYELSTIPGVLLEVAFHDTEDPGDVDDLRQPLFRQIAARAVFQGVVKYYAAQGGAQARLLPEPPTRLVVRNSGPSQVTLTWAPPPCCDGVVGDAATSYKVYGSADGRAFDNGTETVNPSLTLSGLTPGTLRFFRVTAVNAGGESFPSPVVGVRTTAGGGAPPVLVVDGFDRLDQEALIPQYESPYLGTSRRMFLERMNRYDYAVEHGQALASCGLAFDGAVNEAVEAGAVSLSVYAAVDWFVGEDSVADVSLSSTERARLAAYLDGGGRVLLSGSEIGYDLVEQGRDPTFYANYLRASYLGDDAGTFSFVGQAGGPLGGLAGRFDDSTFGTYDVGYPDRLGPAGGSTVELSYVGGLDGGAAVAYDGDFRVVYVGFPLETVTASTTRAALVCAATSYLLAGDLPPTELCAPRLINPGFEGGRGQSAWQVNAPAGDPVLYPSDELPSTVSPHGGDWVAWLGEHTPGASQTIALTQSVALPSGAPTATLTLAWLVHPEATAPSGSDSLSVDLYGTSGAHLETLLAATNDSPANAWQGSEFDLSAWTGQTVQLAFRAVTRATSFFVDDVTLTTCGPPGPAEVRALWVDAFHPGIKSWQEVEELLQTAQAGGVNALVVQVRRRGDTYYASAIDPWASDADPTFDALAYLIARAHAVGIEVHAWATTLAIWGGTTPPTAADHTFNVHGPNAPGSDMWLMVDDSGGYNAGSTSSPLYYLDPGHPDVVDYTVAVYAELAANYDLDGVHLDRVRYPYQDWGYNPTALSRFQAQTGRTDLPVPADGQWLQWRRDQLTGLVRKVYLAVTAINPRLRVSGALSAAGTAPSGSYPWETRTPYTHHLQDWRAWLEEGILDLGLPMNYRREYDSFQKADFDNWITWEKDRQYDRAIAIGTAPYLNAVQDTVSQWLRVRQPSAQGNRAWGVIGYSYATPSKDGETQRDVVNAIVTDVFTQSAPSPPIPWKDTPSLGHLMGTLSYAPPCRLRPDGYPLALSGPAERTLRTDGKGWFGAVDLPPGQYLLSADVPGSGSSISVPVTVTAGAVTEKDVGLPVCPLSLVYLPLVTK